MVKWKTADQSCPSIKAKNIDNNVVAPQQKVNYAVYYAVAVTRLIYLEHTMYCKCEGGIYYLF